MAARATKLARKNIIIATFVHVDGAQISFGSSWSLVPFDTVMAMFLVFDGTVGAHAELGNEAKSTPKMKRDAIEGQHCLGWRPQVNFMICY